MQRDSRLHASRRLDWRFLLPSPALGDVAYIGGTDTALASALHQFADSVTVIDESEVLNGRREGSHDLLVLVAPTPRLLSAAATLVRGGGHLYAEIPRLFAARGRGALRHPSAYDAGLRAARFTDVSLHWHWRTFDACTAIVPLDAEVAFAHWAAKRGSHTSIALTVARRLLRTGVVGWAVPSLSVVARKQDGP